MVDDVAAEASQQILGRSRELYRIDEMVERLATGRGSVVVLIGPPGIGLTTLLEETIARVGVAVENVRAVHVPSGLLEGDPGAALELIASTGAGEALRGAVEAVAQTDGGALAPDDPRLVQVAVAALRTMSSERPLLLTVDNLPVADDSVFNALASLAARIAVMPVLVVITSHVLPRSSFEESPVGPLWVRRVPSFGTADAVALVRTAAGRWVPHSVAATIAHRTGGNPGDLVAVCEVLEPDRLAGVEPLPHVLPGTIVTKAVYGSWWHALGPKERLLVLCAAVAVSPDRGTLEECADLALAEVTGPDGETALAEQDGLVVCRDPRLLSAVRALAPPREVRAASTALAACCPEESLERDWLAVMAGEPVTHELLGRLLRAARLLLDRGEASTVQTLVGDVLRRPGLPGPPPDLLLLGGVAALYCGHPSRAVTLLTRALAEDADGLSRTFPALLIATTYRDSRVPHRLVASCLQRLASAEPVAATSIAALAARLCAEYGDPEAADRYLRQAETLLPDGADHAEELTTALALTRTMVQHGEPATRTADPLAALGFHRPGTDVAGWLLEIHGLGQLLAGRDWAQARGEVSDMHAGMQRFPAPLLRAHLAVASIILHLSTGEYRRADDIASAAVEEVLPLHVPLGGAGIALLAQVALVRGRSAEAESWLTDVGELAQRSPGAPVLAAALYEALGLRARLADDLPEAAEHYTRALHEGRVLPATLIDLVHLRWRAGADVDDLVGVSRPDGGDEALTAAAALVRTPADELIDAIGSVTRMTGTLIRPAHQAQLLELAADRVGALTVEQFTAAAHGRDLAGQSDYQVLLLRRARELYVRSGAGGRADVTGREIARLEQLSAPGDVDFASLTPDELTIAKLVHGGATNKEIAGALYVSVRTVELRLTSIYRKLGIGSRRELRQLASPDVTGAGPA